MNTQLITNFFNCLMKNINWGLGCNILTSFSIRILQVYRHMDNWKQSPITGSSLMLSSLVRSMISISLFDFEAPCITVKSWKFDTNFSYFSTYFCLLNLFDRQISQKTRMLLIVRANSEKEYKWICLHRTKSLTYLTRYWSIEEIGCNFELKIATLREGFKKIQ